jgi:hypothetical protein
MFYLDGKSLPDGVSFEHNGILHPGNWLSLSSPEERAALGITWVEPAPPPEPASPPPLTKDELLLVAAGRRWAKETGGLTLNGIEVSTDDTAQRKISELRRRAEAGEIPLPFGFKAVRGWVDMDLATIQTVDRAIAAHVQSCYAQERSVAQQIESGALTTFQQVNDAFTA